MYSKHELSLHELSLDMLNKLGNRVDLRNRLEESVVNYIPSFSTNINLNNNATEIVNQAKMNYTLDKVPKNLTTAMEIAVYNLIHESANDVNSSSVREEMTGKMADYEPTPGKHGYDATTKRGRSVEIKPKNFNMSNPKSKLNGSGNFTDFTWKREQKYSDDNVLMCVSAFCCGILLFIVEFDYNTEHFRNKIRTLVKRSLPNGDVVRRFCRSAGFTYMSWKQSSPVVVWHSPNFDQFRNYMSGRFYVYFKTELLHEDVPKTAKQIAVANKKAEQKRLKMERRTSNANKKAELNEMKKKINKMSRDELLSEVSKYDELDVNSIPKTKKGEYKVVRLKILIKNHRTQKINDKFQN